MSSLRNNYRTPPHPEDFWKDEWVISRKSIHAAGLIVDHHIEPADEIEAGSTKHHLFAYLLSDICQRQVTRIADQEIDGVQRRGAIWLKPKDAEGFWHWESTDECLIFAINPVFLHQIATETNCLNPDKVEVLPIVHTRDPIFDCLAGQFLQEMNHTELGNCLYVESLANMFAINLLRNYCTFPATFKEYSDGLPRYKLKQAIDYIHNHFNQTIKLSEIAELLDMSQYYFCRLFRESTGVSPYRYIIQQRIDRAKKLIENSKRPLSDIAFECGFSSQSQMTQHFRKLVGVTPKKYRDLL
ncbi:MAG: AraC family transcriptional regulator [Cyanobacteria bacterium P01_A01_bin.83]